MAYLGVNQRGPMPRDRDALINCFSNQGSSLANANYESYLGFYSSQPLPDSVDLFSFFSFFSSVSYQTRQSRYTTEREFISVMTKQLGIRNVMISNNIESHPC